MKRQLTSILLFSALLVGGASTFVSCTDHESDSAYNTSISLADAIAKQKTALENADDLLQQQIDALKENKADANKLAALEGRVAANEAALGIINKPSVAELAQFATLDAAIRGSQAYVDLSDKVDGLVTTTGDLAEEIESFRAKVKADSTKAAAITNSLNTQLGTLNAKVTSLAEAQAKVNDAYKQAIDYLVNKNLNSIAINATENPVLGYYNAAFLGSQLNLAASFYGTAAQPNMDWGIAPGDSLNDGNAGEIYVSLNPTEIDPNLVSVKLVDSQGNEAKGFKLGKIKNTNRVLTYGVTKASDTQLSANGFYAIPVEAVDPANDDFSLNKGELKEAAKNIIAKLQNPKESSLNLSQIATTLYSTVNNQLKAYTVQAEYTLYDPSMPKGDRIVTKHAVAPTYNMAAFAVKPLSFNTLEGNQSLKNLGLALDKYMLPTLSDKLGKYVKALDFQIKNEGNTTINVYSMLASKLFRCVADENKKEVYLCDNAGNVLKTISNATLTTYKTVAAGELENGYEDSWGDDNFSQEFYDKYYKTYLVPVQRYNEWGWKWTNKVTGETQEHKYIQYYGQEWEQDFDFLYVIETTDNTISDFIASLNGQISSELQPVKDAIQNAANKWDTAIQPVNNLLHKINAKIGNVNELLQPTMLYKSSKTGDWNTLSTLGGRLGTRMTGTGSTVLVATSWTGELLAPAYKKSVYVKGNPAGAKVTLMDGTTPAKKIAGSTQKVLFTATAKGNYTIVYEAVDYSGVPAKPKEYHITVE